nr:hypothetical protein [Tanacetum cinerariifolium]
MSSPTILISANSTNESVRSSTSLVILSDTTTELTTVHATVPEIAPKAEAVVVASPAGVLDLVVHSDLETEPSEASPSPPLQNAHAPTPIILGPPALPHRPAVLVRPRHEITFDRPYRCHPNKARMLLTARKSVCPHPLLPLGYRVAIARWRAVPLSTWYLLLPSELSSSSPDLSPSSFGPSSPSPLGTPHSPSGPLHRRRYQSSYFTPSSLVGSLDTIEATIEAIVEIAADLAILLVHTKQTIVERIDDIKQELHNMRNRVAASEGENTTLREILRAMKLSDLSLSDSLRIARARLAKMQFQVRHTVEQLQQCQIA